MVHEEERPTWRRLTPLLSHTPRLALISAVAVVLALAVGPGALYAADLIGPRFAPDVVAPGTSVTVDHFTSRDNCTVPTIYLSPDPAVTDAGAPSLRKLAGRVTYGPGLNTSGAAGQPATREVPFVTFVVPNLSPGTYFGYFSCQGGAWDGYFGPIAPLIVVRSLPATDWEPPAFPAPSALSIIGWVMVMATALIVARLLSARRGSQAR